MELSINIDLTGDNIWDEINKAASDIASYTKKPWYKRIFSRG